MTAKGVIRRSSFRQLVAGVCATLLVAAQVLGLHYHRHVHGAHADHRHAAELHLRDAGLHAPHGDHHGHHGHHGDPGHHAALEHAGHHGIDVEVDVIAEGLKLQKAPLLLAIISAPPPGFTADVPGPPPVAPQRPPCERPARYALSPPSQAPPVPRLPA